MITVAKRQDFNVSLEDTFFKKLHVERGQIYPSPMEMFPGGEKSANLRLLGVELPTIFQ